MKTFPHQPKQEMPPLHVPPPREKNNPHLWEYKPKCYFSPERDVTENWQRPWLPELLQQCIFHLTNVVLYYMNKDGIKTWINTKKLTKSMNWTFGLVQEVVAGTTTDSTASQDPFTNNIILNYARYGNDFICSGLVQCTCRSPKRKAVQCHIARFRGAFQLLFNMQ